MRDDVLLGKLPPSDIEAEQAVLSAILIDNRHLATAQDIISMDDFYRTAHQTIFAAFTILADRKQNIDMITVSDFLKSTGQLCDVGGVTYLSQITDIPISPAPAFHAEIIAEKANLRRIITAAAKIITSCFDQSLKSHEIIDTAQKEILAVSKSKAEFVEMSNLTSATIDRYEEQGRRSLEDRLPGLPIGYRELDSVTGGLKGALYVVIAGRPSHGKTAFALNMIKTMCNNCHKIGLFPLEQAIDRIDDRFFALETGLNTMRLSQGYGPNSNDWAAIMAAASRKSKWELIIDGGGKIHINELKRRCRLMKKAGVEAIFIDQLSFITGDSRKNQFVVATEASNEIAGLKKELNIPIILLAQLNRDLEKRENKEPRLSDLKNSGSLEEDADIVILIHRPWCFDKSDESIKEDTIINIAKNRDGATWRSTNIKYYEKTTQFKDGDHATY